MFKQVIYALFKYEQITMGFCASLEVILHLGILWKLYAQMFHGKSDLRKVLFCSISGARNIQRRGGENLNKFLLL